MQQLIGRSECVILCVLLLESLLLIFIDYNCSD